MEDIQLKQNHLNNLKEELEVDKKEINGVPERFRDFILAQIMEKERLISKLEKDISILIEADSSNRIESVRHDFEHLINDFISHYPFKFPIDRELFTSAISLEANGKELVAVINGLETKSMQGYYNKRLIVTFPDGTQLEGHKITDTFVQTIVEIGLEKVESLGITYLGTPLVSKVKHDKYQQKKLNDKCYILTNFSKEKKREILETIGKKLKIPLTARFPKE